MKATMTQNGLVRVHRKGEGVFETIQKSSNNCTKDPSKGDSHSRSFDSIRFDSIRFDSI